MRTRGTKVVGRTAGEGAFTVAEGRAFVTWFVPEGSNDRTPIGHVRVDAGGNGTLKFEVPAIPGGKYTVLMSCKPWGVALYRRGRSRAGISSG